MDLRTHGESGLVDADDERKHGGRNGPLSAFDLGGREARAGRWPAGLERDQRPRGSRGSLALLREHGRLMMGGDRVGLVAG